MSQQPSCFAKIFCCSKKQPAIAGNRNTAGNANNSTLGVQESRGNRVGNDPAAVPVEPVKVSNIELVTTIASAKDIEFREFYPEEREEKYKFRFYCPICLRYFSSMLMSQCCFNYLCRLCVDDMLKREKKEKSYIGSCPFSCNLSSD